MELLHDSRFVNADNSVKGAEKKQGLSVEHAMQMECARLDLESPLSSQLPIEKTQHENPESFSSQLRQKESSQLKNSPCHLESTLAELTLYEVFVESNRPATEVVRIFQANPLLPGIILTTKGELTGMLSRRRFFEYISRPYSWELFSKRPILALYHLAKTEILALPSTTSIVAAVRQSLQRSPHLIYEPIVVQNPQGVHQLLDVHQLLLAQSQIHDSATEALRQAEAKYRSIFENAVDGIFQTTAEGYYLSANPALARIYGYGSPEELIEKCTDIGRQVYVDSKRRAEFIAAIQEHNAVSRFESQVYRQDGSIIWVSENARAVKDAQGNLLYYEGTVEDITERKQAEAALRESEARLRVQATELETALRELQATQAQLVHTEKMSSLGQMVAGVAHEINNPVNCIYSNLPYASQYIQELLSLLQLYTQQYPQPSDEIVAEAKTIDLEFLMQDLPKILSAMQQGANRIRDIVRSLRTFSRLDEVQMQPTDIHEGIESTLLILHHRLRATKTHPEIQVIKEYGDLPLVNCYAGQLNQVFMNLFGNAIDALESWEDRQVEKLESSNTPAIPTIWIRTEAIHEDWVKIYIADNGPGMTEEVKQRLFEPFFTTKPSGKGTGLGLSISHQIITEKHSGQLKCLSVPGKGATFTIEIPTQH